jgi:DNA (cytosine-5)-methyltransferase 1
MPTKAEKTLRAYYNEVDPYAAQWLRNLMEEGWITKGDVDERSIEDVRPSDLTGYDRLHFFAGVGVWDYALNQAEWGRNKIWTGSCPCQPFSTAGKGAGFTDERHLWPAWFHLIEQCRPPVIFGEQVASQDGYAWLDLVQTDLEAADYAVGPVVLPAAGVGAPHIRHRIFFVADADGARLEGRGGMHGSSNERSAWARSVAGGMDDANGERRDREHALLRAEEVGRDACGVSETSWTGESCAAYPTNGFWRDADWLLCRDGKWRPVEPRSFPLVDRATARVGRLRAYGNAIVSEVAREFIAAYMECIP